MGDIACRPRPDGTTGRTEHYTNAVAEGARAARALLGGNPGPAPVPSFWSHLHNRRLQAVGHTGPTYETRMVHRTPEGNFLTEYHHDGHLVGAATIGIDLGEHAARIRNLVHVLKVDPTLASIQRWRLGSTTGV